MRDVDSELNLPAEKSIEQSDASSANPLENVPDPPINYDQKNVILKMKKTAGFERRFLSARGKSANLCLEVAFIWHDTVLSIQQFKAGHAEISVGSGKDCTYHVDNPTANGKVCLAQYVHNHWEILFNNTFEGFLLKGEKKTEFASASKADFAIPGTNPSLMPDSLACPVDGDVRAKFVFGEVSILIHYVDAVDLPMPLLGGFKVRDYVPLVVSIVLHLIIFSSIFMATERANALMIDRMITSSRFDTKPVVIGDLFKPDIDDDISDDDIPPPDDPELFEITEKPDTENWVLTEPDITPVSRMIPFIDWENMENFLKNSPLIRAMMPVDRWWYMNDFYYSGWSQFDSSNLSKKRIPDNIQIDPFIRDGLNNEPFGQYFRGNGRSIGIYLRRKGRNIVIHSDPNPHLKTEQMQVHGSMDRRIIRKVVKDHEGEWRACYERYERELANKKGLNGSRVVVAWMITPQGTVSSAIVEESTMKNKNIETCITNSVKFWRFRVPKGGGSVMVEATFVFEVGDDNRFYYIDL